MQPSWMIHLLQPSYIIGVRAVLCGFDDKHESSCHFDHHRSGLHSFKFLVSFPLPCHCPLAKRITVLAARLYWLSMSEQLIAASPIGKPLCTNTTEDDLHLHYIIYSILDPGQISGINAVTRCDSTVVFEFAALIVLFCRFPAQETISGASKIPSIIYYDKVGMVRAVGAEATKDGVYEAALEGGWYKAEWCVHPPVSTIFKLCTD